MMPSWYPPCGPCPVELEEKGNCYCVTMCYPVGSLIICYLYAGRIKVCVNPYLDGKPYETCVSITYLGRAVDPEEVLITSRAEYVEN